MSTFDIQVGCLFHVVEADMPPVCHNSTGFSVQLADQFSRAVKVALSIFLPLKNAKAIGEKKITRSDNPNFRALIRGDKDVPALYVSQAMNACGEAGISDISFSTLNK